MLIDDGDHQSSKLVLLFGNHLTRLEKLAKKLNFVYFCCYFVLPFSLPFFIKLPAFLSASPLWALFFLRYCQIKFLHHEMHKAVIDVEIQLILNFH